MLTNFGRPKNICMNTVTTSKKCLALTILTFALLVKLHGQEKITALLLTKEDIFTEAPFKQCHASTLIETEKGSLMAAWFGGSYEGAKDVCIWSSKMKQGKWSSPQCIVCGIVSDTLRYACWNPVLFRSGKKELKLYYKAGSSPREWWGMVITSNDNGETWSKPQNLNGINGPIKNKPLVLTTGTWLNPSSTETLQRWKAFMERSTDKGKTWEVIPIDTSSEAKVIQPALLLYSRGKIQALCRSDQNCLMESWSTDDGKTWSALQKTKILNPNSGIDAVTLSSGLQMLVYNPMMSGNEWVKGRNKLFVAVSHDGITWTDIYKLEDQSEGEFSYPAIIQSSDGTVHITYTFNRKTIRYVSLKISEK
jgi:predicted neuraminidase